jgi:T5SS/PEP-CTERM-associated repeat protein/autotransporter-associated beta strand protein
LGAIYVGNDGFSGGLNLISGGTVSCSAAYVGINVAPGNLNVSSPTSSFTSNGTFEIGSTHPGALTISTGGTVVSNAGASVAVGADGSVNIAGGGSNWEVNGLLRIGPAAAFSTATINISDTGLLNSGTATVGRAVVDIGGAGSQWLSNFVAYAGSGTNNHIRVHDGAMLSTGSFNFAGVSASTGSITVTGPGSQWINNNLLAHGNSGGVATIEIADGGLVSTGLYQVVEGGAAIGPNNATFRITSGGQSAPSVFTLRTGGGTLNVVTDFTVNGIDGTGALHKAGSGTLVFAGSASSYGNTNVHAGVMRVTGGTTVSDAAGNIAPIVGETAGAEVSGAGASWVNSAELQVGGGGAGTLLVQSGGSVSATNGFLGTSAGATGSATVTGANSAVNFSGNFSVGQFGQAALNITSGGAVNNAGGGFMAFGAFSSGVATVDGGTWNNTGSLSVGVGFGSTATLNINNGGVVITSALEGGNASSGINFNGGTLRLTATDNASNKLTLGAAGGSIDVQGAANGFSITNPVGGTGKLIKTGDGTLAFALPLATPANTNTGGMAVEQGTLLVIPGFPLLSSPSADLVIGESIFSNGTMISLAQVQSAEGTIGRFAGSDGDVILSGGGLWQCSALTVGDFGRGTLTVADGAAVIVNSGAGSLVLAKSFVFSRGVLRIGDGAAPGVIQAAAIHGGVGEVASVIFNHTGNYTLGPVLSGSLSVIKQNSGTTTLDKANGYAGVTTIQGGRLILRNNGTNDAHSPIWNAGGADIQAGVLALDYTGLTVGNLTVALTLDALDTGYDQTPKFSSGPLRTSNPPDPNRGLGWNHDAGAHQVLVKYTYYGDSDLNGQVDVADLGILASNWQAAGTWGGGDFDYDGIVNVADLGMLATNWQAGVSNPLGPASLQVAAASFGLSLTSVPEPTTTAGLLPLMWSRRRRGPAGRRVPR